MAKKIIVIKIPNGKADVLAKRALWFLVHILWEPQAFKEISKLFLTLLSKFKKRSEIPSIFVAFSEYTTFSIKYWSEVCYNVVLK